MRIKKGSKSVGVLGKILNLFSNSKEDTYSCDYINKTYGEREISLFTGPAVGDITLLEDVSEFEYIEIFFRQNQNNSSSVKVWNPNNKNVILSVGIPNREQKSVWIQGATYQITGNKMKLKQYGQYGLPNFGYNSDNHIAIERVNGKRNINILEEI